MFGWLRLPLIAALALQSAALGCGRPEPPAAPRQGADIFLPRDADVIEARVPPNATLAGLLRQHDLSEHLVSAAVDSIRVVFDLRRLRADQPYRLVRTLDGLLREFEYKIDSDRFLRLVGLREERERAAFHVEVVPYTKHRGLVALRGAIDRDHPSLIEAVEASGEEIELAIALADIFSGEIDFNNDLQQGDTFQVLFEAELRGGEAAGYGSIVAAEFDNDGRRLTAFRYEVPGQKPGYYDQQGRSLRRFFLRSPLKFTPQISSGFSRRRLHPVHRTYRPHLGVDYRAPRGSPVVAAARGVVLSAGYSGASGRLVRIRHAASYESFYLHLSSFAPGIRAGARVEQGQVIGRVGSSGVATGPHLDYRLKRNGAFINPLTAQRNLPPGEPVPPAYLAGFHAERDLALGRLFESPPRADVVAASRERGPMSD